MGSEVWQFTETSGETLFDCVANIDYSLLANSPDGMHEIMSLSISRLFWVIFYEQKILYSVISFLICFAFSWMSHRIENGKVFFFGVKSSLIGCIGWQLTRQSRKIRPMTHERRLGPGIKRNYFAIFYSAGTHTEIKTFKKYLNFAKPNPKQGMELLNPNNFSISITECTVHTSDFSMKLCSRTGI